MSWETDLAQEFNKRNNKKRIGAVVGTVLQANPLKVGILNNNIILDHNNSYLCNSVSLSKGDKVMVTSSEDNQMFFIVNKVRGDF